MSTIISMASGDKGIWTYVTESPRDIAAKLRTAGAQGWPAIELNDATGKALTVSVRHFVQAVER